MYKDEQAQNAQIETDQSILGWYEPCPRWISSQTIAIVIQGEEEYTILVLKPCMKKEKF